MGLFLPFNTNTITETQRRMKMIVEQIEYDQARPLMKPGDVIAFGGKGHFSELIKFATFSDVSCRSNTSDQGQ